MSSGSKGSQFDTHFILSLLTRNIEAWLVICFPWGINRQSSRIRVEEGFKKPSLPLRRYPFIHNPTRTPQRRTNPAQPIPSQTAVSVNPTSPLLAPPKQTPDMLPVGHTSRAARTHWTQRSLDMVMTPEGSRARSVKRAVPDRPVVSRGAPEQRVVAGAPPSMPPQMASEAALSSCEMMCLYNHYLLASVD